MPIIALTADTVSGAKEIFLAAGMNDSLFKPIDAAEKISFEIEKALAHEDLTKAETRMTHLAAEFIADAAKMQELIGQLLPLLKSGNTWSLKLVDAIRVVFPPQGGQGTDKTV
jgi:CheY-like chemotaxis protein